jgi:hypothetical protein
LQNGTKKRPKAVPFLVPLWLGAFLSGAFLKIRCSVNMGDFSDAPEVALV